MQQLKIHLVLLLEVSLVAYNVYISTLFRDKIVVVIVVVNKARNLAITNVLF
jgi:hypothetical protein